jgi:hypothetical protein
MKDSAWLELGKIKTIQIFKTANQENLEECQ